MVEVGPDLEKLDGKYSKSYGFYMPDVFPAPVLSM